MKNIDLSEYKLVQPSYIKKRKFKKIMYDITVKDDHTFFIKTENCVLLTSNCDGSHITSLIINFFHKWFPYIIEQGRLFKLVTPLVAGTHEGKKRYFFTLDEFNQFSENNKLSNVNYLKGLGSLNIEDWEWVMNNRVLFNIADDRSASKYLDIAFGDSAEKRRLWLENR